MGYTTYWFDDDDDVTDIDFANSLFITEGQVDNKIPLRKDCLYMLHNSRSEKYRAEIEPCNRICFQVYTDVLLKLPYLVKIDQCIYYDLEGQCLYMPWATDLLPYEIEKNKTEITSTSIENTVYWVGTVGAGLFGNIDQLTPFINACEENGVLFTQRSNVGCEEAMKMIRQSYMAPTIVGQWQFEKGYIPCRLFKNISYGKMGITNSRAAYDLFEGKIVHNSDTYQLFYDAQERMNNMTVEELHELMDIVRDKHTYINRINQLLDFFTLVQTHWKEKSQVNGNDLR
jgi:hypothetical protein